MTIQVSITETMNRIVEIEAESEESALETVSDRYYQGGIDLTNDDWIGATFDIEEEES
ncbi:hypothetical protein FACS1894188_13480 [Clostridia bacterium]|nr:hypothetical protein FACS1894188_13480 [Clostridia bacterium]